MFKVGDWVSPSGNGYCRIEKIITRYAQEDGDGYLKGDKLSDLVISKKAFNSNLKFSLGIDQSDLSDLEKVSENVLLVIEEELSTNPDEKLQFEELDVPVIQRNKTIWFTLGEDDLIEMNRLMYSLNYRFSLEELKCEILNRNLKRCLGHKASGQAYMLTLANMDYEVNDKHEELYTTVKLKRIHIKGNQ